MELTSGDFSLKEGEGYFTTGKIESYKRVFVNGIVYMQGQSTGGLVHLVDTERVAYAHCQWETIVTWDYTAEQLKSVDHESHQDKKNSFMANWRAKHGTTN